MRASVSCIDKSEDIFARRTMTTNQVEVATCGGLALSSARCLELSCVGWVWVVGGTVAAQVEQTKDIGLAAQRCALRADAHLTGDDWSSHG